MTQITASWLTSKASQDVCRMLADAGYEAWFVGGCVRNALIGAPVSDLDMSTNALPDVVMQLAAAFGLKAIPTGIDHGTITIISGGVPYEVTTFRRDIATDGRRAVVAFADEMIDDARRRDFTMNALYAGSDGVIADPLDGLSDLANRRVRFIDDAEQRIKEDYLRILRFFRFHAWYGNQDDGIDAEGLAACAVHIEGLQQLSKERVGQEMLKLLSAPNPSTAVASMASCGALTQVIPGADAGALAILVHVEGLAGLAPDAIRRLAVIGGMDVAANLRLSKSDAVRRDLIASGQPNATLAYREGAEVAIDSLAVEAASLQQEIDAKQVDFARFAAEQVFPVKAADLMPAYTGPALGAALKKAEVRWIASDFTLTKDALLE